LRELRYRLLEDDMRAVLGPAFVLALSLIWGCDDSPSTPTAPTPAAARNNRPAPAPLLRNFANTTVDRTAGFAFDGLHTLTFIASPTCSQIPIPLRTRTFTTSMVRVGDFDDFTGELSGADLVPDFDTFSTAVHDGSARFNVSSWQMSQRLFRDEPIVELVGTNSFVSFQGTAVAALPPSPTAINARFDGSITFCSALLPPAIRQWRPACNQPVVCRSDRHQLRLIPR
jgi:hypothetical protein